MIEQTYNRVVRAREKIEDAGLVSACDEAYAYLCQVEKSCENVIDFLNGEYAEWCETQKD